MKRNLQFLLLILLSAFALLTYLVYLNLFNQFDFDTTLHLQNFLPRNFDAFFSVFSFIGNLEIAGLILLLCLYIYRKLNSFIILLFFVVLHLPEVFLKSNLHHPAPPIELLRTLKFINVPQISLKGDYFSYPSGHSARTIFISTILFFIVSKLKISRNSKYVIYGIIVLFDVLMLVSRVYLGEHWVSDVVGGSLLGALFAVLPLAFI